MHSGARRHLACVVCASAAWVAVSGASLSYGWQLDAGHKLRSTQRPARATAKPTPASSPLANDRIELKEPASAPSAAREQNPPQRNSAVPRKPVAPADSAASKTAKNNPSTKGGLSFSWDDVESFGERIGNALATGSPSSRPQPAKNSAQDAHDPRIVAREKARRDAADAPKEQQTPSEPTPAGMAIASDQPTAMATDVPSVAMRGGNYEAPTASTPAAAVPAEVVEAPDTLVARTTIEAEPAHFKDVQPGTTTAEELELAWGPPRQIAETDGRVEHVYALAPFELVVVTLADGVVSSIFVSLREPIAAEQLSAELGLKGIEPVSVPDEVGTLLGEAYPERGVLFSYAAESQDRLVARIIVETIDAEPFVRRGEANVQLNYQMALDDLDAALRLDPTQHRAHWLRAQLFSDTGREHEALVAIDTALSYAPDEPEYRLTKCKILSLSGKHDAALEQCEAVLAMAKLPVETEAHAWLLKGDFVAAGSGRDYKRAMEHHVQAIKLARPLAEEKKVAVRRAAQDVLVSAHLAVARDIAWGVWNHKEEVVPKWIAQADSIAAAAIRRGDAPGDFHFRICQQALAAYVGMQGAADPTYWTEETVKTGQALIEQARDPWYRRRLEWELGMTLYDAVQVYHMRREYPQAMRFGPLAVQFLRDAEADRQDLPGHDYLMGRLYFRMGAIHLAHEKDHSKAIPWFNQSVPLMEKPIPASAMADIGRQGETFVSMAVSYWETGDYEEAVRLTTRGVELMERAVDKGILHPEALAIGYGNLASMHSELGHADEARSFDELASRSEAALQR